MPNYLGQHFLKNTMVVKKIIVALDIQRGDMIVEVGPGHGELTIPLMAAAEEIGGVKIIAVEKDKKLAEALTTIDVVNGDILKFLETELGAKIGGLPFKLVGNIPYYLTGHLLRIVSELEHQPERAVFMIQKEVAERICAVPPRMNRLAASVQFWAEPKIIATVPRGDFSPPPEVDSAVIELEARKPGKKTGNEIVKIDVVRYYTAVRALFAQPRKTILNNLGAKIAQDANFGDKNAISAMLSKLGIDPKLRPQDLTIENIAEIAANF